jgi:hypothetical protein
MTSRWYSAMSCECNATVRTEACVLLCETFPPDDGFLAEMAGHLDHFWKFEDRPTLLVHVLDVLNLGAQKQVARVAARRIVAAVKDALTVWNRSILKCVSEHVSAPRSAVEVDSSVSVDVRIGTIPEPAIVLCALGDPAPEPRRVVTVAMLAGAGVRAESDRVPSRLVGRNHVDMSAMRTRGCNSRWVLPVSIVSLWKWHVPVIIRPFLTLCGVFAERKHEAFV